MMFFVLLIFAVNCTTVASQPSTSTATSNVFDDQDRYEPVLNFDCGGNAIVYEIFGFRFKQKFHIIYQTLFDGVPKSNVKLIEANETLRNKSEEENFGKIIDKRIGHKLIETVCQSVGMIWIKCEGDWIYNFNQNNLSVHGRISHRRDIIEKNYVFPKLLSSLDGLTVRIDTFDKNSTMRDRWDLTDTKNIRDLDTTALKIERMANDWIFTVNYSSADDFIKNEELVRAINSCHNLVLTSKTVEEGTVRINGLLISSRFVYPITIQNGTLTLNHPSLTSDLLSCNRLMSLHAQFRTIAAEESTTPGASTTQRDIPMENDDYYKQSGGRSNGGLFSFSVVAGGGGKEEDEERGRGSGIWNFLSSLICGDPEPNPYVCRTKPKEEEEKEAHSRRSEIRPSMQMMESRSSSEKDSDPLKREKRAPHTNNNYTSAATWIIVFIVFLVLLLIHLYKRFKLDLIRKLCFATGLYQVQNRRRDFRTENLLIGDRVSPDSMPRPHTPSEPLQRKPSYDESDLILKLTRRLEKSETSQTSTTPLLEKRGLNDSREDSSTSN